MEACRVDDLENLSEEVIRLVVNLSHQVAHDDVTQSKQTTQIEKCIGKSHQFSGIRSRGLSSYRLFSIKEIHKYDKNFIHIDRPRM